MQTLEEGRGAHGSLRLRGRAASTGVSCHSGTDRVPRAQDGLTATRRVRVGTVCQCLATCETSKVPEAAAGAGDCQAHSTSEDWTRGRDPVKEGEVQ